VTDFTFLQLPPHGVQKILTDPALTYNRSERGFDAETPPLVSRSPPAFDPGAFISADTDMGLGDRSYVRPR
jgi:hypothetical protein